MISMIVDDMTAMTIQDRATAGRVLTELITPRFSQFELYYDARHKIAYFFNKVNQKIGTVSLFGCNLVFCGDKTGNDFDTSIRRFHGAKALEPLLKHTHEVFHAV
jgi:hypothetical protein